VSEVALVERVASGIANTRSRSGRRVREREVVAMGKDFGSKRTLTKSAFLPA
jgi:hypothetical protein